ncbi:MAG: histidine phosphatase family protein [Bacteroidetes bacterium]|nr:MAG: histidine phosphatase family protein [Bacteroidota bacterium]
MKTLILARHAKSEWPDGVRDLDRPLKERGRKDAAYLAGLLADQGVVPDLIISSPAQRARQTAGIFAQQLAYPRPLQIEPAVYYDGINGLLSLIGDLPDDVDTVMIFGHNPTMEDMVTRLLRSQVEFTLPTSALACFESWAVSWAQFAPANLHLRWLLVPRLQRKSS